MYKVQKKKFTIAFAFLLFSFCVFFTGSNTYAYNSNNTAHCEDDYTIKNYDSVGYNTRYNKEHWALIATDDTGIIKQVPVAESNSGSYTVWNDIAETYADFELKFIESLPSGVSYNSDSRALTNLQFTSGTGTIIGNNNYSVGPGKLFYRSKVGDNGAWTSWTYFEVQPQYRTPSTDSIVRIYGPSSPDIYTTAQFAVVYELRDNHGFLGAARYFNLRSDYFINISI